LVGFSDGANLNSENHVSNLYRFLSGARGIILYVGETAVQG